MLISYFWLKRYIKEIPKEEDLANLITFHICELESIEKLPNGDTIFDIKILPDRAHDLLSHKGVACEIAGLLGLELKTDILPNIEFPKNETSLQIEIESPNCRRYMGRIVRGIKVGPSPEWMKTLIESIGGRSINNIVDATNYVLFNLGQPIHAFDLDKLSSPQIIVRNAKNKDKISLVGQEKMEVTLSDEDLMITDGQNNLAIAGVKGGLLSAISDNTQNILIEVANFNPVSTRKTSRRLCILSDASKRYENDLPIAFCDNAMKEISNLIKEMCPEAIFENIIDICQTRQEDRKVFFTTSYISKLLGVLIKDEDIEKILRNYQYNFNHLNNIWEVKIPVARLDITGPHDMAEEIGRVYGYEKIISKLPKIDKKDKDDLTWVKISLAKEKLIRDGYKEIMTYIFRDSGEIEIMASASDKNFLRANLSDGFKESLSLNQNNLPLLGLDEIKIFEVGTIFNKKGEEIHVIYGDKKNVKEVTLDDFIISNFGDEINQSEYILSAIKWEKLSPSNRSREELWFKSWSIYPFITRDIAVWVPELVSPEELVKIYKDFGTELLVTEPRLFDSFTKDGKTSYAYRLVFQSYDRTLTDEEVGEIMAKINEKIASLGWQVR